jgi:hypothetical protein
MEIDGWTNSRANRAVQWTFRNGYGVRDICVVQCTCQRTRQSCQRRLEHSERKKRFEYWHTIFGGWEDLAIKTHFLDYSYVHRVFLGSIIGTHSTQQWSVSSCGSYDLCNIIVFKRTDRGQYIFIINRCFLISKHVRDTGRQTGIYFDRAVVYITYTTCNNNEVQNFYVHTYIHTYTHHTHTRSIHLSILCLLCWYYVIAPHICLPLFDDKCA